MQRQQLSHQPVLANAVLEGLAASRRDQALYIDGTLGAGGHSAALLNARDDNRILGIDLDPTALELAKHSLEGWGARVHIVHGSYLQMRRYATEWLQEENPLVDGILLDLGVSSMQFDRAERGFSFRYDAPLDMRFDPTSDHPTAADLLNLLPEKELADMLYRYGEEKDSRRIARRIVENRPLKTTTQLADLIAARSPREKIHPATRTFQALRIAVNDELATVEKALPLAVGLLKPAGRLAVITFHSLEDRIVKQMFKEMARDCICPSHQPYCTCDHRAMVRPVTHKPIVADGLEVQSNPRARSAKLRIVEKL